MLIGSLRPLLRAPAAPSVAPVVISQRRVKESRAAVQVWPGLLFWYNHEDVPALLKQPGTRPNLNEGSDVDSVPDGKRCTKCGEWKPDDAYSLRRDNGKLGLKSACRQCARQCARLYFLEHREHTLLVKAAYRSTHKDEIQAYDKAYRAIHHDRITARDAAYRAENREKIKARDQLRDREPHRQYSKNKKRRAFEAAAAVLGPVDYAEIGSRDRAKCWICKKVIVEADIHFDHAVSLSAGGEHSTRNIRMSHSVCNLRKAAKSITHQMNLL